MKNFCDDSTEYLSSSCNRSHKGERTSWNNGLLNVSDLSDGQTATNTDADLILSDCVQHSTVTSCCKEHGQIMCSHCKILRYKRCKTITIQEKSQSYSENQLHVVSEIDLLD